MENLLRRSEKVNEEIREKLAAMFGDLNVSSAEEEFLERCVAVVNRHLSAVGYSDPKYFSTSFKKCYGVLPSEYEGLSKRES